MHIDTHIYIYIYIYVCIYTYMCELLKNEGHWLVTKLPSLRQNLRHTYGKPTALRLFAIFIAPATFLSTWSGASLPWCMTRNASKDSCDFCATGPLQEAQKGSWANGGTCCLRQTYGKPTANLRQEMALRSGSWCVASNDFCRPLHFLRQNLWQNPRQTYGKPTALRLLTE